MRSNEMNQMLRGAAVAALLILPTLAHAGPQRLRRPTGAVRCPPPPMASQAEAAQARAEAGRCGEPEAARPRSRERRVPTPAVRTCGWSSGPRTSYTDSQGPGRRSGRHADGLVKDGGPVLLEIAGIKSRVDDLDVGPAGDTLQDRRHAQQFGLGLARLVQFLDP